MSTQTCLQCGNWFEQKHPNQYVCSPECVEIRNKNRREAYRKRLLDQGMCRECWHNPVVSGNICCQACLDKNARKRKQHADANPQNIMLANAKRRATEMNLPFDLVVEDIVVPEVCPIFGIPLKRGVGVISDSSPTLDKIIPSLGYVKGNVVVISRKANRLKNNASLEEMIKLGKWAEKYAKR